MDKIQVSLFQFFLLGMITAGLLGMLFGKIAPITPELYKIVCLMFVACGGMHLFATILIRGWNPAQNPFNQLKKEIKKLPEKKIR
jgi:hypothetical protein